MVDRPTMLNKQTLLLLVMAPWLAVTAPWLLMATFRLLTSKPRWLVGMSKPLTFTCWLLRVLPPFLAPTFQRLIATSLLQTSRLLVTNLWPPKCLNALAGGAATTCHHRRLLLWNERQWLPGRGDRRPAPLPPAGESLHDY